MNYGLAYAIGFHPWEDSDTEPGFVKKFEEVFDREEARRSAPYGKALDLGCGSAIWGVRLAKRGWDVTGVDNVDKALRRGQERINNANVKMRLVNGDVTALTKSDVGRNYDLILDTGTFHGLTKDQRLAMGREVSEIAKPEATLFLLVWPARRRPLIRGADRIDVEAAFPGWEITYVEPSGFVLPKPLELILAPGRHRRPCSSRSLGRRPIGRIEEQPYRDPGRALHPLCDAGEGPFQGHRDGRECVDQTCEEASQ